MSDDSLLKARQRYCRVPILHSSRTVSHAQDEATIVKKGGGDLETFDEFRTVPPKQLASDEDVERELVASSLVVF